VPEPVLTGVETRELLAPLTLEVRIFQSVESQYLPLYTAQSGIYSAQLATARSHAYTINLVESLVLFTISSHNIIQELDIYVPSFTCHILSIPVTARSKA